jgi:hypothetical protein
MHVSSEDVAEIYARACRAWYGARAPHVVAERINKFRRNGDASGLKARSQVAAKLSHEWRRTFCIGGKRPALLNAASHISQ